VGESAMIKSLLEPDERQPEKIKIEPEEKKANDSAAEENFESYFAGIESPPETGKPKNLSEISEPADDELIFSEKFEETMPAATTGETFDFSEPHFNQPENSFAETADESANGEPLAGFPIDEINFELPTETTIKKSDFQFAAGTANETASSAAPAVGKETTNFETSVEAKTEKPKYENSGTLFQPPAEPESFAETARRSGMAYAAAISLFGSVVFMLIIGWFADLLLGSSPWGIVGGIVLGAAIGFFQFFRLTSQIFKK